MVFQGTVLGPPLWSVYFEDSRLVAAQEGFEDTYFADDLNLFRSFPSTTGNHTVTAALDDCQKSLHQ